MPRFHFHLRDELDTQDEEGVEVASVEEAISRAVEEARVIAAEEVKRGKLHLDHQVTVTDERGSLIKRVRFPDCIEIVG